MECPNCHTSMKPCEMNPEHMMCQHCNGALEGLLPICQACMDEYNTSIRFRLVQMTLNPETAKETNWCDTCNDWMPWQHQHKARKSWQK